MSWDRHTNFVADAFIREGAGRRLAEEYDPPFPALGELETLVMDLMRQLTRWGEYESADTGAQVRFRSGDGRT